MHRIFTTSVASVYPLYVAKLERKGRTALELDEVICWLTGYTPTQLHLHLNEQTTFDEFFSAATINGNASKITGTVCGARWRRCFVPSPRNVSSQPCAAKHHGGDWPACAVEPDRWPPTGSALSAPTSAEQPAP